MRPQVRSTRTSRSTPAPVSSMEDGETIQNVPVKKGATIEKTTLVPSEPANTQETSTKRSRHRMTSEQLVFLEDVFKQDTHPSKQKKKDVAGELNMNFKTVTIWFQNRRQITKKNQAVSASATPVSGSPAASTANEEDAEDGSALRRVSSPSENDTLTTKTPVVASIPLKDSKRAPLSLAPHGENNTAQASKGFCIKIKPLAQPLQSRSQNVEPPRTRELWEHLSSSPTISEWSFQAGEDVDVVDGFGRTSSNEPPQVFIGKRPRTLEWACEREAKRRRLGMGEDQLYSATTHSQSSKRDTQEGTTPSKGFQQMDPHAESALLLLSLSTGAHTDLSGGLKHTAAPQDVMHGASLLLCFKHSVRH
ncbi:hypothetical protein SERLA73DRAFT_78979 [Serpula lacrymans var. lacrymans S7.3]|uniref:Homeobox domain-containing protein n=1 Tax=Serpula lacrymans var. lacrymans (strain S7.3) TaxID=936435 RepID=F8QEX4_SERL3|nr:hypothetical protein SERLA73DRAFT_78979 [Serpula lacrymans var. lacrymans S7.3]